MKEKKWLILLTAVYALCVTGMILALTSWQTTVVRFTPPPPEPAAQSGVPEALPEDYGEIQFPAYRVLLRGRPELQGSDLALWLTNPESNGALLKVRILDTEETLLGESGLLNPGEYVQNVALTRTPEAGDSILVIVMGYEPETYHSVGNLRLQITIPTPTP